MRKKLLIVASLVLAFAGLVALVPAQQTGATPIENENEDKIWICHRTNSVTNPYVKIEVDKSAVDGDGNNDHSHHTGPLVASVQDAQTLKDAKIKWGDIIPSFDDNPGLNWSDAGESILEDGCLGGQELTEVSPAVVTFTNPTCDKLGSYTIPTTENVVYKVDGNVVAAGTYSVPNGTTVTVMAEAEEGFFIGDETTDTWTNTFTAPECGSVLGTTTPTKLPVTSGDTTIANITLLSMITGVITVLGFAARSILAKQL